MPTPRKYPTAAARHKAFRERKAQAARDALAAKGLPPAPPIATMPGAARWNAMLDRARALLQDAHDEMQDYHADRSEAWQEGERGERLAARIDALADVLAGLDGLPE